jgi:glycosyltransferase involved in cell wall biosynthesis
VHVTDVQQARQLDRAAMPLRRDSSIPEARSCVLLATDSVASAQLAALAHGLKPEIVLDRFDCAGMLRRARVEVRNRRIQLVAIHSSDWTRQPLQRLYEYAALRLPVERRVVLDGHGAVELDRRTLIASLVRLPLDVIEASMAAALETRWALISMDRRRSQSSYGDDVLVVWRGDPALRIGGSVTHAAGMFSAFKALGLRVCLVTSCRPPQEIVEHVADLEVAAPLPPSHRLTREFEWLTLNASLRDATRRLSPRIAPRFVYQRCDSFLTAGVWASRITAAPLVTEWNGSEAWVTRNWQRGHAVKRIFEPLLGAIERRALRSSAFVRAISANAAEMAVSCGARRSSVTVIPNGVDTDALAPATANGSGPRPRARLGWIGTFGPWHGAPLVVEALAALPLDVTAVMVGDGAGRPDCEQLAERLGVAERIRWTGGLPHADAIEELRRCDVLLSPHTGADDFFGSPTKLFEYMAIGRPIVASSLGQIAEVLEDGVTAKLVTPGDSAALAEGVTSVIMSPDGGAALGQAARQHAEREHSWINRAQAVLEALENAHDRYASR